MAGTKETDLTGVDVRAYGGFTVMDRTDVVVVSGHRDSPSLYQFPVANHADQTQVKVPCKHVQYPLCLDINDKQCLALSCDRCKNMKLINPLIEEGEKMVIGNKALLGEPAFEGERVKKMCVRGPESAFEHHIRRSSGCYSLSSIMF